MFSVIEEKQTKIVIEKSKFFGYIFPCSSQEMQNEILKNIKRQNLSATHICFASLIYKNSCVTPMFSDDREPSGTAGAQILQALKEQDLINTLCVVVRYFGGIKLGVAGLGRAYKESALSTIYNNKKEVSLKTKFKVTCNFNNFNKIKPYLLQNGIEILEPSYIDNVTFFAFLNLPQQDYLKSMVEMQNLNEETYC